MGEYFHYLEIGIKGVKIVQCATFVGERWLASSVQGCMWWWTVVLLVEM
jgi:hypothetical protein